MKNPALNHPPHKPTEFFRPLLLAGILLAYTATQSAFGASATWNATTNTSFNSAGNWVPSGAPGISGNASVATSSNSTDIATFSSGTANLTVNLPSTSSSNRNIGGFVFDTSSAGAYTFTYTANSSNRYYFTRGQATQINSSVANAQNLSQIDVRIGAGISGSNNYTFLNDSTTASAILTLGGIANYAGTTTTLILRGSNTGNNEVTGVISENGGNAMSVSKQDAGTWILGSANTYTGGTTLSAGVLGIGSATALGSGTLTINGGAISSITSARTLNNTVVVGGDFSFGGLGQSITLNGTVDLGGATRNLTLAQNSATLSNVVSNGGITLESSSASRSLTLSGNNTYSGGTTINGGSVVAGNANALGSASGSLTVGASGTLDMNGNNLTVGSLAGTSGGTITNSVNGTTASLNVNYSGANSTIYAGSISDGSGTGKVALVKNGTGAVRLSGNTYSGGTTLNTGTIELASSSALGTGNVTINGGALASVTSSRTLSNNVNVGGDFTLGLASGGQNTTLNGAVNLGGVTRTITLNNSATFGGVISNGGLIISSDSSSKSFTMNGENTYSGSTTMNVGILQLNGSLANSAVNIGSTGTLRRSAGNLGAMNVASLTLSSGAAISLSINGTSAGQFDSVNSSGAITLNGNGALTLNFGRLLNSGESIDLFTGAGSIAGNFNTITATGSYSGAFSLADSLWTYSGDSNLTFDNATGTLSMVPEPSTYALLILGLGAVVLARRRFVRKS